MNYFFLTPQRMAAKKSPNGHRHAGTHRKSCLEIHYAPRMANT